MDCKGNISHGKKRALYEDYKHFFAPHTIYTCSAKRRDFYFLICATVSVLSCLCTCISALYCHRALVEIRNNHNTDDAKFRISSPEASITKSAVLDEIKAADYHSNANSNEQKIANTGDSKHKDDITEVIQLSDELAHESSLYEKKHTRMRRSTKKEIKQCKKNCKGKGTAKRNCRKACNKDVKTVQSRKINNSRINLPAAHFEANMRDALTQKLVETLYNTFKGPDEGPLKIFRPAKWVDGSSPVSFNKDSVATAKSSGIFLVYAQAYIGGAEPEKSISVVQKRGSKEINVLSCDNGVNSGNVSDQMQSCSVFGLMKLEADDTIEVQRSEVTTGISLDEDKTFFGLVQLSGITVTG